MILILAAVPLETRQLRRHISSPERLNCGSIELMRGQFGQHELLVAHSGVGQVNMALTASRLLESYPPSQVFLVGCGGSYPNSGLSNGDLVLAASETYADLGVETASDFVTLEGIGADDPDFTINDVQQSFTFNKNLVQQTLNMIPDAAVGPVATVNCCSGTPALSRKLEQRTQAICENMEGAAAAQVCAAAGIPMIELRGISNPTGTRDPQQWELIRGVESAQAGLIQILEGWNDNPI